MTQAELTLVVTQLIDAKNYDAAIEAINNNVSDTNRKLLNGLKYEVKENQFFNLMNWFSGACISREVLIKNPSKLEKFTKLADELGYQLNDIDPTGYIKDILSEIKEIKMQAELRKRETGEYKPLTDEQEQKLDETEIGESLSY